MIVAVACGGSTDPQPALVRFKLDAPFCGSVRLRFSIDRTTVGEATVLHDSTSSSFPVNAGSHELSATLLGSNNFAKVMTDTTASLKAGEAATIVVPVYCS